MFQQITLRTFIACLLKIMKTENMTSTHKKCDSKIVKNTNNEAKSIAKELKIDDSVEQFLNRNAYITIKDHKKKFHKYGKVQPC